MRPSDGDGMGEIMSRLVIFEAVCNEELYQHFYIYLTSVLYVIYPIVFNIKQLDMLS